MSILDLTISLDDAVADLRSRVSGAVLTEHDPNYAESCAAWNVLFQHHPAVLVVAESAADIAEAVRFARAGGFRVAIQATGHGVARPADGAVLIVTSSLTDVVDRPRSPHRARVAAGAKWGAVLAPAQEHGLAPLLGSTTDVGAVGYTLGGGMGWLARRYGLASDSVRSFDLVTPDGDQVRASSRRERRAVLGAEGRRRRHARRRHRRWRSSCTRSTRCTPATCCTRSRWPPRSSPAGATGWPAWTTG